MMCNGSWWTKSVSDSRFNMSGYGVVGGFSVPEDCMSAIKSKEKELGIEMPDDLEYGYMKD